MALKANKAATATSKFGINTCTLQDFHDIVKEVFWEEARSLWEETKYNKLLPKEDKIENRRRLCSFCLLGIPEEVEQGNPTRIIAWMRHEVLGGPSSLEKPFVLDRAHWMVAPSLTQGGRPWTFIISINQPISLYFQSTFANENKNRRVEWSSMGT